ncbi:hypothetical protein PINS_up008322 [Pythium insidiosum]|nr:hypothetical protein PINS_up008322 [Pythium insidiosum]
MEAVKRKPTRKQRKAAAKQIVTSTDESAQLNAASASAAAETQRHATSSQVIEDEMDMDDEIASNEADIMALLGTDTRVEPVAMEPTHVIARSKVEASTIPSAIETTRLDVQKQHVIAAHRVIDVQQPGDAKPKLSPGSPGTMLPGTLTAMAVPSAPSFNDSDDEEDGVAVATGGSPKLQASAGADASSIGAMSSAAQLQPSALADASSIGAMSPAAQLVQGSSAETMIRDGVPSAPQASTPMEQAVASAPSNDDESPRLPAVATSATAVPSAPLNDDFAFAPSAPLDISSSRAPESLSSTVPSISSNQQRIPTKGSERTSETTRADETKSAALNGAVLEKAGSTFRQSMANLSSSDHGLKLYPAVVTKAHNVGTGPSASFVKAEAPKNTTVYDKRQVFIKLEPHSNFEMSLLRAAATQKRQEAKMHNIEINKGDLFSRLERYLYAEYLMHAASAKLDSMKKEVDLLIQRVWTIETKRLSAAKKCGDQVEIEETLEFQMAKFEPHQLNKLKQHLDKLRRLRTVEASLHTQDRALSFFHVEQYLNEVLQEPDLMSYLNKMSATCSSRQVRSGVVGDFDTVPAGVSFYEPLPNGSALSSSVDHLKFCIDVLIFFEKQVTTDERGIFGRVPPSFARGELIWHSTGRSLATGSERKIRCYACASLNSHMEPNQWCKLCEGCGVILFLPPSAVSTKSTEWYAAVLRFRQSLQKWISICMRYVLRLRSLSNMPYVLMHVMYLPRISTEERSWILRFLQFPKYMVTASGDAREEWSEDMVDHYIAMMHLVFHPEKLRRLCVVVSSEPSGSRQKSRQENGKVSPEWVLLENPDFLDQCYLSDEDFVAVLDQFPNGFALEQLFRCTLDTKKSFSRALTLVIEFTQGLRLFQEFEKFPARVAQLLGDVLLHASFISAASSSQSLEEDVIYYPTLYDQLFLTALHGLLVADCNRVAWRSIKSFPFAPLSDLAKWDVLALLLFGIHHVPSSAKTASGWADFIDKACVGGLDSPKKPRDVLYEQIVSDTESALHLLNAVARLAASCNTSSEQPIQQDLVRVAIQELFLAGFANFPCRMALGESGERAAGPMSTVCLAHPWIISEVISLLFKYHECAETWIHVFETFPVNRWLPSPQDLGNLQEWLTLDDPDAPRSALARFLLDRINWEFDHKSDRLFTSSFMHRQVALVVAEALITYRARHKNGSEYGSYRPAKNATETVSPPRLKVLKKSIRRALRLEPRVNFEQWCWRLILKLKFYSPTTHEPFIDLIDIRNDRSREALLLRRWFAGGISAPLAGVNLPFYSSLDVMVKKIEPSSSVSELDRTFQAAFAGAGCNGAPIQSEEEDCSRSAGNPNEPDIESTVAVTSTCDTEPIVAYLICQMTTFVYSSRIDRWEPLLILVKNEHFGAAIRVLDNLVPMLAKLRRLSITTLSDANVSQGGEASPIDHEFDSCMAAIQAFSTDQMLNLLHAMRRHSFISSDEQQLLSELLQKGYIGGWESTAKMKVVEKLRFVRDCSRYLHPLLLPSMINEAFPQSSAVSLSTSAILQGAMSWLTAALRGGTAEIPSPSEADSIANALSIRRSHLVPSVPTVTSSTMTAAAAVASMGMIEAPDEFTPTTRALGSLVERAFDYSSSSTSLTELSCFWTKTILQVPFWHEHPALRFVMNVLLRCSMMARHFSVIGKDNDATNCSNRGSIHLRVLAILQLTFRQFCLSLTRAADRTTHDGIASGFEFPSVVSFLPVVETTVALRSLFGGAVDPTTFVSGCSYLALWLLLIETKQEVPLFIAMGQVLVKFQPKAMSVIEKMAKSDGKLTSELKETGLLGETPTKSGSFMFAHTNLESLSEFKIYRWIQFCIALPEDDGLQILFWQVFFALYFACTGGSKIFGHHFLERNDSEQATQLRKNLQLKLRSLTTHCSNRAQGILTSNGSMNGGAMTREGKEKLYQHFVQLSHIYSAMDTWLEEQNPNTWVIEDQLTTLPRHFEVARLREVLALSDRFLSSDQGTSSWGHLPLWTDLCGFDFQMQTRIVSAQNNVEDNEASPNVDHLQEEDFAFIEDSDTRRHSSLGGSIDQSRHSGPLPLTAEFAGPLSLTVLPHVSIETGEESCALTTSVALNRHALKGLAIKFSESMSILVGLDAEILDHVSKLYSTKSRVITESKPCIEGANCRSPASFRFEFAEGILDRELLDTVHGTISQTERYDMKSMAQTSVLSSIVNRSTSEGHTDSGLLQDGVDLFLRLDADGLMLSMQILLVDRVIQCLETELHKKKREAEEANATSETNQGEGDEDHPAKTIEKQLERLHEKGLEWFRQLTELDNKLSRMVPPLREVLWRGIKQLGVTFVCVDERETCNLLQLMLDDPTRITLLSECFSPASAPARFVEMFSNLMSASASAKLSHEDKLVLLQRFDFVAWLNTKPPHSPTRFDRDTILCIVLGDIVRKPSGDSTSSTTDRFKGEEGRHHSGSIIHVYAKIIHLLCLNHLGDHLEKVLHALVGVHGDYRFGGDNDFTDGSDSKRSAPQISLPAHPVVWEAVSSIPLSAWQQITPAQVQVCLSFMGSHISALRWQCATGSSYDDGWRYPLGMWQNEGVLKHFLDLFSHLWRSVPSDQQWSSLSSVFEALMLTLYQPATTTDSSSVCGPWSENDTSSGSTLCSSFVSVCGEYLKPANPGSGGDGNTAGIVARDSAREKLDTIWNFYLGSLIPNAPHHVCKIFHQFLTRIAWEQWRLTLEIVQRMREVVQFEKDQQFQLLSTSVAAAGSRTESQAVSSSYPYVSWMIRDVLCRMTWKTTDEWLSTQNDSVRSLFLCELAKLCMDLVLDVPHFQPQHPRSSRTRASGPSSNVMPPYFVNFIKQLPSLWTKWTVTSRDLEGLLHASMSAVTEPLQPGLFPSKASASVMQDAFTRLQLILRLLSQLTTLQHSTLSVGDSLRRSNQYLRMVFSLLDNYRSGERDSAELQRCGWLTVLFGAACVVLYEKLDEVVVVSREFADNGKADAPQSLTDSDLLETVVEILRFFNLRLVEPFFKHGQIDSSSAWMNWGKCGNIVFVEVDGLIRDFTSTIGQSKARVTADSPPEDEAGTRGTALSSVESIGNPLGRLLWSFMGFRGGELCCLSACGRAIASVSLMSMVAERSIEKWVIEERRGTWSDLTPRLRIPELSEEEFEQACLQQGSLMTMLVLFLQRMGKAPMMTEAFATGMLSKLMGWMEKMQSIAASNTLTEMKILFFAAEVTNFVFRVLADILPSEYKKQMLRELCNIMLRFGNARRQHGIMKAIGIGGSLKYNVEFHVSCLTVGIFLRLQTRNGAPLRVEERIPYKMTRTTEKHLRSLEQLLSSKNCFQLQKRMEWMVEFLKSPTRSLADQDEFFVSLFSRIYPSYPWLLAKCISST